MLKEKSPRPKVPNEDRAFWVLLRRLWPRWSDTLVIVQPETVVRWHRAGFRPFWRRKPRRGRVGRPIAQAETRELIHRTARENATWGAPRIHGELLELGISVSERTVQRYIPRRPAPPGSVERWKAFLRNHGTEIVAMDFLTVPTVAFRVLYVETSKSVGSSWSVSATLWCARCDRDEARFGGLAGPNQEAEGDVDGLRRSPRTVRIPSASAILWSSSRPNLLTTP